MQPILRSVRVPGHESSATCW